MTKVVNQKQSNIWGDTVWKLYRKWEVQKKPYKLPLPFDFRVDTQTSCRTTSGNFSPSEGQWICGLQDNTYPRNQSYAKLVEQLGDTATWANNLHEARGAIDTIERRAMQITNFAKAVRKGNFGWAVRELGFTDKRGKGFRRPKSKDFGGQFLELHFFWEPAIQDIGAAMNVLTETDFGEHPLSASSTQPYNRFNRFGNSTDFTRDHEQGTITVKQGALFTVTNPNAFLANRMGFANPLSVAWEAVPFSFVADWFGNVGQCLSSMTDFVGVSVQNAYNTTFQQGSREWTNVISGWPPGSPSTIQDFTSKVAYCTRGVGLSGPTLAVKPFKGFSVIRATTAISLLVQQLK